MNNLTKKHQQPSGQGYHASIKDYRREKIDKDKQCQELREEYDDHEKYDSFLVHRSEN